MSWDITTTEWHRIENVNEATKKQAMLITEYIRQLNQMDSIRDCMCLKLSLTADGETVSIDAPPEVVYGEDTGYEIWDDERRIMQLAESLADSKEIEFSISFHAMLGWGKEYGLSYWTKKLDKQLCADAGEYAEHKLLEDYQIDERNLLKIDKDGIHDALEAGKADNASDVDSWYSIATVLSGESERPFEENLQFTEKLTEKLKALAEKHDDPNPQDYPKENLFCIDIQVCPDATEIPDLIADIEDIAAFAEKGNVEVSLDADFISMGDDPFVRMIMHLEKGKVITEYYRV